MNKLVVQLLLPIFVVIQLFALSCSSLLSCPSLERIRLFALLISLPGKPGPLCFIVQAVVF